jgi:hypothetical protein
MRTRVATAGLLTAALAAGSSFAAPGPPPATVKTVRCSIARHDAAFHARMHRLEATERMAIRFTLLERAGDEGFAPVRVPGLGRWHRSRSGVSTFGYRQGVRSLVENAVYRMRVEFRWYTSDGDVLRDLSRRSPPCRQYVSLPNLRAELLGQRPAAVRGVVRYRVRVKNDGGAATSDASVALIVDGHVVDTVGGITLAAGERTEFAIRGPACRQAVEVGADPEGAIAESSEDDNVHSVRCEDLAVR